MLGIIETKMLKIESGHREQIDIICRDLLAIVDNLKKDDKVPALSPPSPTEPAPPPDYLTFDAVSPSQDHDHSKLTVRPSTRRCPSAGPQKWNPT